VPLLIETEFVPIDKIYFYEFVTKYEKLLALAYFLLLFPSFLFFNMVYFLQRWFSACSNVAWAVTRREEATLSPLWHMCQLQCRQQAIASSIVEG
jgi:hypothetical protein